MGNNVYKDLHNLHDENDFVYPDDASELFGSGANDYQQSIQTLMATAAVVGCVSILIVGIAVIFVQFCKRKGDEDDAEATATKVAKYSRWVITVLILVPLILAVVYAFALDETIQDVQDTMNESYTPFGDFITSANAIQTTLGEMVQTCSDIQDESTNSQVDSAAASIQSEIVTGQGFMEEFLTNAGDISWEDSGDALNPAREVILYVCLGITAFLLIILIISLLTSQRHDICGCCVSIIVIIGMLIVWIFASLQFGISVEVADICADPNDATIQAVSSGIDGLADFNDTLLILEYYVYCDADHSKNPLLDAIDDTQELLGNLSSTIESLQAAANATGTAVQEVNELSVSYNKSVVQTGVLAGHLECDEINGYYNDLVDSFCYDLLDEWFSLYLMQGITVALILLRLCIICRGDDGWQD